METAALRETHSTKPTQALNSLARKALHESLGENWLPEQDAHCSK